MNLLEFLDRRDERRMTHPRHRRDIRQFIGFMFLLAYYGIVLVFVSAAVPEGNRELIRDAMLTLGPLVGLIVAAMFRTDAREEQATANTAHAFQAVEAAARAGTDGAGRDDRVIREGDDVTIHRDGPRPGDTP